MLTVSDKNVLQARKERSKSVQALVDFVRRRDPRVKEYRKLLEEKQRENEEKAKQRKAEQLQAELLRAAEYEEKNRKNLEEEERLLAQLEKELGFSETESYTEDISEDELDELEDLEDFDPDELTEDQKEAIRKQMERDGLGTRNPPHQDHQAVRRATCQRPGRLPRPKWSPSVV